MTRCAKNGFPGDAPVYQGAGGVPYLRMNEPSLGRFANAFGIPGREHSLKGLRRSFLYESVSCSYLRQCLSSLPNVELMIQDAGSGYRIRQIG